MSATNQGAHILSGLSLGTTAEANGFVSGGLTGSWTEATLGDNFVLTSATGNAVVELMSDYLYSGKIPTTASQKNFTSEPLFGYIYIRDLAKIAKIVSVVSPTKIIIDTATGASSSSLRAASSKINPPSKISFSIETLGDFLTLIFPNGTTYTSPPSTAGNVFEKVVSAGEGTLEPFLSASNVGSGGVSATIEY